ncbi:MAG: hypothetical protein AB7O26_17075 [Planctomycetaceae bacterium]
MKNLAISLWLSAHMFVCVSWSAPVTVPSLVRMSWITQPYMLFLGHWQSWAMFAPNPRATAFNVDAVAILRDGSRREWRLYDPVGLGPIDRRRHERMRKFANDNLRQDYNRKLWSPVADYVAGKLSEDGNPVVYVSLVRSWSKVPGPGEVPDWSSFTFYRKGLMDGRIAQRVE